MELCRIAVQSATGETRPDSGWLITWATALRQVPVAGTAFRNALLPYQTAAAKPLSTGSPAEKAVAEHGIVLRATTHRTANGLRVDFNPDEVAQLADTTRPVLEKRLEPMLASPSFRGLPKAQQDKVIRAAVEEAHKEGAARLLATPAGRAAYQRAVAAAGQQRQPVGAGR